MVSIALQNTQVKLPVKTMSNEHVQLFELGAYSIAYPLSVNGVKVAATRPVTTKLEKS